ncbi:MAG TPA: ABC transporter ATP-binding protein [Bradyrhizobium sp.]|nr:ABC transporter ATP-binding protein [Bradyrhizobium sp.]
MPPLVQTMELSKYYPSGGDLVRAVHDVSVSIARGEFVAVCGRSGSGKSTLLNLLGLLERPDRGEYALSGRPVAMLNDSVRAGIRGRDIGFIFQIPALVPRTSAVENVELPLIYAGFSRRERRARALEALNHVGLAHRRHHWPNQLSGGEQQRVVVARAMVNDPTLILADEPTGALDSATSDQIISLFEELHRDGRTIIIVTHAAEVAARAQRRLTLQDGEIVEDDGAAAACSPPSIPYPRRVR